MDGKCSINTCPVNLRAQLFLSGDDPRLAYEDILEVLKDEPEDFFATCVQAKCMFMMGDFEKCLMVWHKANKIRGNVVEVVTDDGQFFLTITVIRCKKP